AAGLYAPMADTTYANGLAATGGSVALRILGATTAIDAVGWGNATSTWLEGTPAPAPPAASSLERLPGGSAGSGQDTNDNSIDFVVRAVPEPQNAGSAPIPSPSSSASSTPRGTPSPSDTPSPSGSGTPGASATPSPTPSASVAASSS